MTWAIVIGWILSVVLHEFSHGLVAYLGGDYTIRERGGLTLNPFQYVNPVTSLLLPLVFLLMGGIPLPGGATFIRRDLLRTRAWESAVSAAGPACNFLLFLLMSLPFHPRLGWVDTSVGVEDYRPWQIFLATSAQLQMIAVVLNLIPIPPLDGFGILSPYMEPNLRTKLTTPPISTVAILFFFIVLWSSPALQQWTIRLTYRILIQLGFDYSALIMMLQGFNIGMFGHA
jgi:Zn-dependent protease